MKDLTNVFMLGRNIAGIIKDASNTTDSSERVLLGPHDNYYIVHRENDGLIKLVEDDPKALLVKVGDFQSMINCGLRIICNGGTTSQLLPTIKWVAETCLSYELGEIQKNDGHTTYKVYGQIRPRRPR